MHRHKMTISRILNYIVVDGCTFKTIVRYYTNNNHISIISDYAIRTDIDDIRSIDITDKEWTENRKTKKSIYRKEYYELNKDKHKEFYLLHREEYKEYYEMNRDKNSNRMGSKEHSITLSCALRHIDIKDFNGFADKRRPHIKPVHDCIKINEWFRGSNAHHITKSIIIYIPEELHRHISHNLATGYNMGEINALGIQFVNGGL